MSHDVIIVGAGAAGTFAAQALAGTRTLVLDVGQPPPTSADDLTRNQFDLKQSGKDLFSSLIGEGFESLHNVHRSYLSPKLKAPRLRYVTDGWQQLSRVATEGFDPMMSFATGGLANAWGAGTYRFLDEELQDFPIRAADLDPHYDALTEHIGIVGTDDDLHRFFGTTAGCQPVHRVNRLGEHMGKRYQKHREHFHRHGIFMGAPRMAVLSQEHRGRPAYDYQGLEFFKGHIPSIYNPAFTLREMVQDGDIEHRTGVLVERYERVGDSVRVFVHNLATGERTTVEGRRLVLAAGALNSARLVLQSHGDATSRLPLLDNQISYVPFVALGLIGKGLERESLPVQMILVLEDDQEPCPIQASFYGVSATLWNDLLFDLPLACRDNMRMLKYLLPAMSVVQLFYPDHARPENYLQLGDDGALQLHYQKRELGRLEQRLIRAFRRIGYFSWAGLCKYPDAGNSFHYAGCLPMQARPSAYQTDVHGRLGGEGPVFVADAANFTSLPSKNLTMTIMANARRIGGIVREEIAG